MKYISALFRFARKCRYLFIFLRPQRYNIEDIAEVLAVSTPDTMTKKRKAAARKARRRRRQRRQLMLDRACSCWSGVGAVASLSLAEPQHTGQGRDAAVVRRRRRDADSGRASGEHAGQSRRRRGHAGQSHQRCAHVCHSWLPPPSRRRSPAAQPTAEPEPTAEPQGMHFFSRGRAARGERRADGDACP